MNTTEPHNLELFDTPRRAVWREFIDGVRQERTGWRDAEISARHRMWGASCPAVDLDFVLAEIHLGEPVAIVEYKHHRSRPVDLASSVYIAMRKMADRAGVPFLIAWYWKDDWAFRIKPVNVCARQHFEDPEDLTERGFVERLYRMRRLVLTGELRETLSNVLPPVERRRSAYA